jgi:hypothetical protein
MAGDPVEINPTLGHGFKVRTSLLFGRGSVCERVGGWVACAQPRRHPPTHALSNSPLSPVTNAGHVRPGVGGPVEAQRRLLGLPQLRRDQYQGAPLHAGASGPGREWVDRGWRPLSIFIRTPPTHTHNATDLVPRQEDVGGGVPVHGLSGLQLVSVGFGESAKGRGRASEGGGGREKNGAVSTRPSSLLRHSRKNQQAVVRGPGLQDAGAV